ncbi:MAG TPA: flagellar basal body rod C-terminal domain-containing protein, partial [Pseudomonadales bacterium]|nr:flagellar basal body rod C-terminal domain-containing protein [Pseudomonadales bacterium]
RPVLRRGHPHPRGVPGRLMPPATYRSRYTGPTSRPSTTRAARIDSESSSAVLEQTRARREQLSGVNLDEEAANLIRFEQAYNASAQVIAVARQVMDALFAAFR